MLLDLLGFVIAAAFGSYLLGLVVSAVRAGRIRHTGSISTYSWQRQPVRFCLVALVFVIFGAGLFYCAFLRAAAVWHRLAG
jgi:hypothetical protein